MGGVDLIFLSTFHNAFPLFRHCSALLNPVFIVSPRPAMASEIAPCGCRVRNCKFDDAEFEKYVGLKPELLYPADMHLLISNAVIE